VSAIQVRSTNQDAKREVTSSNEQQNIDKTCQHKLSTGTEMASQTNTHCMSLTFDRLGSLGLALDDKANNITKRKDMIREPSGLGGCYGLNRTI